MNRISKVFQLRKPFIGYLTVGDGGFDYSFNCALALIEGGVDILELGFPFSDPIADGPIIQKAHERSLKEGTNSLTILSMAKKLRQVSDVPLVLFSYYNPILQRGVEYLYQLKLSGFDAVLIVDLAVPLDTNTSEPFFESILNADLLPILLVSPSTSSERLLQISQIANGFVYYVSQKGTTGIRSKLSHDFSMQMSRIRKYFHVPIVSGFGIANQETAKSALEFADGFVVGSAFVEKIEEKISPKELTEFAKCIDPRIKR